MNGSIELISKPGEGSSFILTIPAIEYLNKPATHQVIEKTISEAPKKANIMKEEIIDLPGLIESLERTLYETLKSFELRQPIGEVREFGKALMNLGTKHNSKFISKYGEEIVGASDSFNIDRMLSLIREYKDKVESLKQ
jgi:hypothetical protein